MKKKESRKHTGGKPAYVPNEVDRQKVINYGAVGLTGEEMARCLRIDYDTLKKYYDYELATAKIDANRSVGGALYTNAVKHNNVTAQIFWLKTQARWKETIKVEHDTENLRFVDTPPPAKTYEEWLERHKPK